MMDIILDEKALVSEIISKGEIGSKPVSAINLLIKYYYINGIQDSNELNRTILDFLEKNYKGFSINKWYKKINMLINKFLKDVRKFPNKKEYIKIDDIKITEGELLTIESLNDIKLEKIAFIMLIYAKISNKILGNNNGWINKSCSTICKEAKVNIKKGESKELLFNKLYNLKYISQNKDNSKTGLKINYIDEESPVKMTIVDFDYVIYNYIIYKDSENKYIKCERCGKYVKTKSNNRKYCSPCSIKENIKKTNSKKSIEVE